MTILGRLMRPRFSADAGGGPTPWSEFWYQDPVSGYTYMRGVSQEAAMRNSTVWDCVRLLSEDIAKLPLIVYRRLKDGGKERATDHALYDVLHSSPNNWQTSFEWRQQMQAHVELRGNGYSFIQFGQRGFASNLEPIDPDKVQRVVRERDRSLTYLIQDDNGKTTPYGMDKIFHLRGFSLDGLKGMSTIAAQHDAIGLGLAAQQFQAAIMANGITLSGVFQHPQTLTDKAWEHLKQSIAERQGSSKAGGFMILEEGMKWEKMSMTLEDAQFLELRKLNRSEIAAIFRVPPHKVGDLEKATFANIEHQSLEYVIDGLMARLVRWEQSIKRDLIMERDIFAEFLVDALLRGDLKARYDAYKVGIEAGFLNPNEARSFENMNPREGGDKFILPLNMETVGSPRNGNSNNAQDRRLFHMLQSASIRLANKELVAMRKASAMYQGTALIDYANEFYAGYRESLSEYLQIPIDMATRFTDSGLRQLREAGDISEVIDRWENDRAAELIGLAMAA
jgi:HK97 family phage portal protein